MNNVYQFPCLEGFPLLYTYTYAEPPGCVDMVCRAS